MSTSPWGEPKASTSLPQRPVFTSYASGSALLHDQEEDEYFEWESNLGVKRVRDGYDDAAMLQEQGQEGQVSPEKRQRAMSGLPGAKKSFASLKGKEREDASQAMELQTSSAFGAHLPQRSNPFAQVQLEQAPARHGINGHHLHSPTPLNSPLHSPEMPQPTFSQSHYSQPVTSSAMEF